jgi:Ca2+/Na+ antiporter
MKSLLSSSPVLWFLFLFNLVVALAAPFVVDGAQGIATSIGMAAVAVGAGLGLRKGSGQRQQYGQRA